MAAPLAQQMQPIQEQIQTNFRETQANFDQMFKQMHACNTGLVANIDGGRLARPHRQCHPRAHLPLFYLGLRLPNDAAWPTGTGGPMPWSKLDIMNYDEPGAEAALAPLGLPLNPQDTLALRKRSLARFFGFYL
ncbi:uncharacterized protein STEHIDRAFT_163243 [Stereum hirsutum FP-91666 SS1]|uniref:Uncharacterized protein n=1 Tax=Stereum hirsutum (strain FP-91666) TaxID=721885 RepID=R7RXB4_STEHR|nr:uncharacterized protein STEHIDRAFT_163243 [Stereum hirsutum FP-91666 SS1]EIM79989.1 hypothetical protein STEHIDRAFT_163243 [Stereum hirsutum FP-91666 SS1]